MVLMDSCSAAFVLQCCPLYPVPRYMYTTTTKTTLHLWSGWAGCLGMETSTKTMVVDGLGLAMEFRSEKIPRNRLGMASVIPRKKALFPRQFRVLRKSQFKGSERKKKA
jgi:hypothetical protein